MFNPEAALAILSKVQHLKPVFSARGETKGKHIEKAYRFEGAGRYQRHISISRNLVSHGVTVYVNEVSTSGVKFPKNLSGIEVLKFYPLGTEGKTGDKGLSAAAAGMPTLLPKNNNVYRLAINNEAAFRSLLNWYFATDRFEASGNAKALLDQSKVSNAIDIGVGKAVDPKTDLDLNVLVDAFNISFAGQEVIRLTHGMGIRTRRYWIASIYISDNAEGNLVEVALEPNALSGILNGCPVHLIERWIAFHQQTTGNEAKGHRNSDPWPCIGFTSVESFHRMLADWKALKISWKLFQKPHAALISFIENCKSPVIDADSQMPLSEEVRGTEQGEKQGSALPDDPEEAQSNTSNTEYKEETFVDEVTLRAIKTRRGQSSFRSNLLKAYRKKCTFTGCPIENVLEAAHITSHSDGGGYSIKNGLLLRADIHTLFDLYLIGIDSEKNIRISRKLKESDYFHLEGRLIRLPTNPEDHPCREGLASHLEKLKMLEVLN